MRPPRYYDQDFMAQRWSHYRGSTVLHPECFVDLFVQLFVCFYIMSS